jgi:hypothetical protein
VGGAEIRPLILPLIAEANQTYGGILVDGLETRFYAYVDIVGAARV